MGTCEGSATQALEATRCGSFDFARRLASLRMTLHSVIAADQVEDSRVSRSGRLATDQKSGPKAGSRASSPGEQAAACDYRKTRVLGYARYSCQTHTRRKSAGIRLAGS